MQHIRLPGNLTGYGWMERQLQALHPAALDPQVTVDFSAVTFVRPSGFAFTFTLCYTLAQEGYAVRIIAPTGNAASYMRRAYFFETLAEGGIPVPQELLGGYNFAGARTLIECRRIESHQRDIEACKRQTAQLKDQFELAIDAAGLHLRTSSTVWSELCGNAAEHSRSPLGAFVVAQTYESREIEIAIADVGIGIYQSLAHLGRYADDQAAILGATEYGVTGRVDAAGKPVDGGMGLWQVLGDADRVTIRSGSGIAENTSGSRDPENLLTLDARGCARLRGTIVTATVFTSRR